MTCWQKYLACGFIVILSRSYSMVKSHRSECTITDGKIHPRKIFYAMRARYEVRQRQDRLKADLNVKP